jgi:eukaryotic-like serine/threonine-protein kinase
VREIGMGAMGRVLLARDAVLERHVAIKVLRDDLSIAADVREGLLVRMRHEARAAARVTHPHLVVLHDMGEDDEVGLYLVFEYLEGPTLKQRLAEGRLSARQAARMARELGSALSFAHERGVLHRDVKPENIILSPTGAKITDFGIARVPDSTLTHAGGLLGTPAYSAPETFRESRFSHHSDQFSLAATLYEAISGERAFPGDDAVSVASKIANDPPAPFAADLRYPDDLDAALLRGMAKNPSDRFGSCKELGQAVLDALLANPGAGKAATSGGADRASDILVASRLSKTPNAAPELFARPKPLRVFLGGVTVLVLAGLVVRSVLRDTRDSTAVALASSSTQPTPQPPPPTPTADPEPTPRKPRVRPVADTTGPETSASAVSSSSAPPAVSASAPPVPSASQAPSAPPPASSQPPRR